MTPSMRHTECPETSPDPDHQCARAECPAQAGSSDPALNNSKWFASRTTGRQRDMAAPFRISAAFRLAAQTRAPCECWTAPPSRSAPPAATHHHASDTCAHYDLLHQRLRTVSKESLPFLSSPDVSFICAQPATTRNGNTPTTTNANCQQAAVQ